MNLPTKLTVSRIILVPVMIFFYLADFIPYGKIISALIFVVSAYTDHLDGHIARKYNMITNLGKFLDPIADKMLTTSALILIAVDGTIPNPYGVLALTIFVSRDLIVSALRLMAATNGVVISADIFGKFKTFSQCIALPILMVYSQLLKISTNQVLNSVFGWTGFVVLIIATIMTIFSGTNYVVKNKDVLK